LTSTRTAKPIFFLHRDRDRPILTSVNTPYHIAFMGPLGMQEMIVIFLIILLLFGAKKIPELARGIGKGMGEFKKAKEDFEKEIKVGEVQGKSEWEKPSTPGPVAKAEEEKSGSTHD
jgi:sec-independent protein translocase protein TatA